MDCPCRLPVLLPLQKWKNPSEKICELLEDVVAFHLQENDLYERKWSFGKLLNFRDGDIRIGAATDKYRHLWQILTAILKQLSHGELVCIWGSRDTRNRA